MTAFPASIATDYLIFDGNETLTLIPDGETAVSDLTGSVYSPDKKTVGIAAAGSTVEIRVTDRWIDVFAATLPSGRVINTGDVIRRSDNTNWYVLSAAHKTFDSRWHCLCRQQPA